MKEEIPLYFWINFINSFSSSSSKRIEYIVTFSVCSTISSVKYFFSFTFKLSTAKVHIFRLNKSIYRYYFSKCNFFYYTPQMDELKSVGLLIFSFNSEKLFLTMCRLGKFSICLLFRPRKTVGVTVRVSQNQCVPCYFKCKSIALGSECAGL